MGAIKDFFSTVKARIKARLSKLPPPDQLWRERRVYMRALLVFGDKVAKWEPSDFANLDYIRFAVRAAELAGASGATKYASVYEAAKVAFRAVEIGDTMFDTFWETMGHPFLESYVKEANEAKTWIPPV